MFNAMARRQIPITINGTVTEKAIFMRDGKSSRSIFLFQNVYRGTHPKSSVVKTGDQLTDGTDYYLVESVRKTPDGDRATILLKCNQTITIMRLTSTLDINLNPVSVWTTTFSAIKVNAEYVTGALREKEPGLLANTVLRILIQKTPAYTTYDDPNSDFVVNDRIVLGTSKYQVTAIDAVIMNGMLTVQVTQDVRQ